MSQPALRLVDKADMDKSKALDAALGQIEKEFWQGLDHEIRPTGKRS